MEEDKYNSGIGQLGLIKEKLQTLVIDERYAEELAVKQAATPPQPPIDEWSFMMGRAETTDRMYRAIEDVMFNLAPLYEDKTSGMMRHQWNDIVFFKDSLKTRFREIMNMPLNDTTPQE